MVQRKLQHHCALYSLPGHTLTSYQRRLRTNGELTQYTLTDLYNAPPTWLAHLHQRLDEAIFAALPRAALRSRVDVYQRPAGAQARLSSYPRTTLNVLDTPLNASHAGVHLVGTCSLGGHDLMSKARRGPDRSGRRLCPTTKTYPVLPYGA
jgi:hypothetical protein